jgi:hypothetical protein
MLNLSEHDILPPFKKLRVIDKDLREFKGL